ncbi:MAG: EF-hand domain-containing protein [Rhodoferax sp.]|nr:EF-hand domain-containing protein [Rhodoferax sp.]
MSSISSASRSSNVWAALNTQRNQQHQSRMFAKVDTDGSGSVDQTELSSMLSDISAKTGTSLGDSKELFTKMDSNGDGSLSSDELAKGMKDLLPPPSTLDFAQASQATGEAQGPKGPPPADGPGAAGGAGGASATSGSSTTFDPLDINKDGTVSEMERLAGALKELATATQTDSSGNSSSTEIAKLAQKLYDQISKGLVANASSNNGSQLSARA